MKVKFAQKPFAGRKPKSAANYGLYRSDDRVTVDITRREKRLRKAFMHSTHGGANPALLAARAWRDILIASVPAQFNRDMAQRPRRDSKGIPGVFCVRDVAGRPRLWLAKTQLAPGLILTRAFSVGRYGRQAKSMALAERVRQLQLMELKVVIGSLRPSVAAIMQKYKGTPLPIALEHDEALLKLPDVPPDLSHKRVKTGFSGVECSMSKAGKPLAWIARTRAGGRYQRKVFPVAIHGSSNAKKLAIEERRRQLKLAYKEKMALPRQGARK